MNAVLLFLVVVGLVGVNLLRGGMKLAYALPAYGCLAVAAVLSVFLIRRIALGWTSRVCLLASTLCFGYLLVRTQLSPYEYLARFNLCLLAGCVIAYLLTVLHVTSPRLRVTFVGIILLLGVANCAVGAIQFFKTGTFMPFSLVARSEGYGARASGFFLVPNSLAGFLEICLLMGLSMIWWGRWSMYAKVLGGYAILVCLGGIVLSGSRGGYISTAFGLLVFTCISVLVSVSRLRERAWLVIAGVACVAMLAGFGIKKSMEESYVLQSRASSMFLGEGDTRITLWRAAMKQFSLAPVTGTGSSTYLYYGRQFRTPIVQTDPMLVHNEYLQLLAEYGIIGMIGMFLFVFEHVRSGQASVARLISRQSAIVDSQSNTLALTIGSLSCVAAYAVHAAVDFNFHVPANALVMAVLFGFLAAPGRETPGKPSGFGRVVDISYGVILAALGAWLAFIVWTGLPAEFFNEKAKLLNARWESVETDRELEKLARRGLEFDARNPELQAQLSGALLSQARDAEIENPAARERLLEESVEAARRASELVPQDSVRIVELAQALDAAARYAEAGAYYQRALELDPNSGWIHWAYAVHFHLQRLLDQAEAEYLKAQALWYNPSVAGLERIKQERQRAATTPPKSE